MRQLFCGLERMLVVYGDYLIIKFCIQNGRYKACSDSLNLMRSSMSFCEDRRSCRLDGDNLNIRIFLFQIFSGSGKCSACTYTGKEGVYLSVCILPDLRAGSLIMCLGICRVVKLSGKEGTRRICHNFLCLGNSACHTLASVGKHQLRAVSLQNVPALHTHGFRHGKNQLIALCRRNGCKSDSRVSGGGFYNGSSRFQFSGLLCVLDHCFCNSVLHTARRIKILQLYKDSCLKVILFLNVCDLNQRCFPDQFDCSLIYLSHDFFLSPDARKPLFEFISYF